MNLNLTKTFAVKSNARDAKQARGGRRFTRGNQQTLRILEHTENKFRNTDARKFSILNENIYLMT